MVRDRESDPRTEIPRGEWEFVDGRTIRLLPRRTQFEPFRIYELWYEATEPTVLGIGFASVRDLVSFLRFERTDGNRCCEPVGGSGIARPRLRGIAERSLPAPFPRAGHERRTAPGGASSTAC